MMDPVSGLSRPVVDALVQRFGAELREADPVIRPANPRQTDADVQVNAAMALAKKLGVPPRDVAAVILEGLQGSAVVAKAEIAGPGFVNVWLRDEWIAAQADAVRADAHLGVPQAATPETIPLDYSSPNAAKEMHVGHLRTTVVGDSLARVLEKLGNTVVRQNHLGDWGTAFGMLIEHLIEVGEDSDEAKLLENDPNTFYQHARAKFDTALKAEPEGSAGDFHVRARARVAMLQSGDPQTRVWWNDILTRTKTYLADMYALMNVTLTHEHIRGESAYNDELADICDDLETRGIATMSDGALCIFLEGYTGRDDKPLPIIIRKSDGGYGYATTDIATARYRSQVLGADRSLYVVGAPQALHFQMCWEAARKAGYVKPTTHPIHVQIGSVLGADGKMLKSRSGEPVSLRSLLDEAVSRATAVIKESPTEMSEAEAATVSRQIGIGAVRYADLSVSHDSEYIFDFDRMLALQGNTGPYLQYAAARIRSMLARATDAPASSIRVDAPQERALALKLLEFGPTMLSVGQSLEPHRLCTYLFELAQTFTAFYENCPVLKAEDAATRASRLALAELTLRVLTEGLDALGIETPERM